MHIRKLTNSDAEQLQEISRLTFAETFNEVNSAEDMQKYLNEKLSLEQLKSELENPHSEFYFVEEEHRALGYLKLNFKDAQTEIKDENAVEIERIYVLKECIGRGLGQFLMEKAIEIAKKRNCNEIWLGVWDENYRALRFYEKNGFEVFGNHDFILGNDVQTDLLMKKPI